MAVNKKLNVSANPLPLSFKEFSKDPVKALLFLALCAMSYMYITGEKDKKEDKLYQKTQFELVNKRVDALTNALRKCEVSLSSQNAKFETLQKLGKIPKF